MDTSPTEKLLCFGGILLIVMMAINAMRRLR
jgi:hypothetical protein